MKLEGSCHCGAVRFSCESAAPYPFMYCYCSICRKTAGAGGCSINLHPFASSIDTPLPKPPERYHILLDSRPGWVPVPDGAGERHFDGYPDCSLVDWHRRHGLIDH